MQVIDKLSLGSVKILQRLDPDLLSKGEIPAGSLVSALETKDPAIAAIFKAISVSKNSKQNVSLEKWLVDSFYEALLSESKYVEIHHLILGFLHNLDTEKYYLAKREIPNLVRNSVESQFNQFIDDLSFAAKKDKSPYFGSDRELTNLVVSLSQANSKPVLLVGESGSGKTRLMVQLARLINKGKVPDELKNARVLRIHFTKLLNAVPFENGQFPNAFLSHLFTSLANANKADGKRSILFFDDMHFGPGFFVGMDTAGIRGDILIFYKRLEQTSLPKMLKIVIK